MKSVIVLLLCISYAMSTQFCLGLCWQQNILTNGSTIAFETSLMSNLFIGADGLNCANRTTGRCGSLYGIQIPLTGGTINTIIPTHRNVQWLVQQSGDFYCFRNVLSDAYLYLSGSRCRNMTSNMTCGSAYLYRSTLCNNRIGFKIAMFQNYYILQSVLNPNLYLFFNTQGCIAGSQRCGSLVGYWFNNIDNIRSNAIYRGAYFNIPYQLLPTATPVRS
jgi:hypothetical protein